MEDEPLTIQDRYHDRFGILPPLMYWNDGGPKKADLGELMEAAIKRGTPITATELCEAQGITLPEPPSVV